MSSTLYQLTGDYLTVKDMMLEEDVDEQTVSDTLEGIEGEFEDKAESYAMVDRELKVVEDGLDAEIERLQGRKSVITNNRKRLKKALEQAMIVTGKRKFKTNLFSFNIQKNPASVEIIGEVPEEYLIAQEPKIDKKAIIAYVKEHGDTEYAKLTQGESLRIR